jgi:hypothetical protein
MRILFTMAADPLSPGNISYLCEAADLDRKEAGRPIELVDLPKKVRKAIEVNGVDLFGKEAA